MCKRKDFSLLMMVLLCMGLLIVPTACNHAPCEPGIPYVQVQGADGMVSITSTVTGGGDSVTVLGGSDGQQLQHVDDADAQLTAHGIVYLSVSRSASASIVAIRISDGKQLWQFSTDRDASNRPIVVQDGVLYALGNTALHAIRISDGTELWTFQPQNSTNGSFITVEIANGMAYIGGDTIFAVHLSDGTLAWQFAPSTNTTGGNFAVVNGVVYTLMNFSTRGALALVHPSSVRTVAGQSCLVLCQTTGHR